MLEIPADKSSIELLDVATPTKLIALEPSGLRFNKPVKLTLPNDNEFPVGMELVILSKNSSSGLWEVDGAAKVVSNDKIETLDGQGITHFSEVYAAPYGLKMEAYEKKHQPGIFNDKGGLSKVIDLPSYKVNGKDNALKLVYNNLWAAPNTLVTNVLNTPTEHVRRDFRAGAESYWGGYKVDGFVEVWQKPEYLMSQFTSGNIQTPWLYYDLENAPEKSMFSYGVDMSSLESGVYPAVANYVLQYRYIKITSIRKRKENRFTGTKTIKFDETINELMDKIYPPELRTKIYHQNKVSSEFGKGWKLGVNGRILNPKEDNLVVEEANGQITPYVLDNIVSDIYTYHNEIKSANLKGVAKSNELSFVDNSGNHIVLNTNGEVLENKTILRRDIQVAVNRTIHYYYFNKWHKGNVERVGDGYCERSRYVNNIVPFLEDYIDLPNGEVIYLDQSLIYSMLNSNRKMLTGAFSTPAFKKTSNNTMYQSYSDICQEYTKTNDCGRLSNKKQFHSVVLKSVHDNNKYAYCDQWIDCYGGACEFSEWKSTGIPVKAHSTGSLSEGRFNELTSIIPWTREGSYLVADKGNHRIMLIDLIQDKVSVFAGNGKNYDSGDGQYAVNAGLRHPTALTKDQFGNIYVINSRGILRKINTRGIINTIGGRPVDEGGTLSVSGKIENFALNNPK